jgi:ABC-type multidrug transport system ATPase subunit
MITYAARLRMSLEGMPKVVAREHIRVRVMQVLEVMELVWCKDRVITERPSMRGTLGGELRRLSIAVEFINLPPVMILDDPTRDLDSLVGAKLVECLVKLTNKGHTVISSFPKPSLLIFNQVDKVVLISGGRSIYDAPRADIVKYFTSSPMDYQLKDGTDPADFVIDIAEGIERPTGARKAPLPEQLQSQFEASRLYVCPTVAQEVLSHSALPLEGVTNYGYFDLAENWRLLKKTPIVVERALYVKLCEREVFSKSLKGSVVVGLFCGYFLWGDGRLGEYALSFLGMPYPKTTNVTANLFLFYGVQFGMQVINVHITCQKLQVFRYERSAHCCPTLGFWASYFLAEVPFVLFFALIFANLVYWMSGLSTGADAYFWFMGTQVIMALLGMTSVVMFAAVTRREIVVRDLFLLFLFLNTLTSGFLFPQITMRDSVVDISVINPMRWAFQAVMNWKFRDYPDGVRYLSTYSFENFEKDDVFQILFNFIIFDLVIIFLALIPLPNTLRRRPEDVNKKERRSSDLNEERFSARVTETVQPKIFTRESSTTGTKVINSQPSATGLEDEVEVRGPTVFFHDVTFRVPDRKSPLGYKNVLHKVTGRFDWGKLGAILGAAESGKSTLLHVLSGQKMGASDSIRGGIYYNNKAANPKVIPWQRCAFVEAVDEHYRDLSVKEVVTYAMKLRCMDKSVFKTVELNVKRTVELLQLTE